MERRTSLGSSSTRGEWARLSPSGQLGGWERLGDMWWELSEARRGWGGWREGVGSGLEDWGVEGGYLMVHVLARTTRWLV